ncbi:helix-turn-helix domain-containing protein [Caloranaerobacter sp. DY30410]|uniref:helix-turn-helix domain-containing protein n=1 Tax=Caloranaerobacter sp. DY30410 TaxID=3238305 RepID=UPI003D0249AF
MSKRRELTLFGVKVKKRLIELDMTQKELAKDIGVHPAYLTDILRGNRSGRKYKKAIIKRLNLDEESESLKEVV